MISRKALAKKSSPSVEGRWQRLVLAAFAVLFLAAGGVVAVLPDLNSRTREFASGTLLKVGVVLGIAWLAAPQLERFGWQRLRGTLLAGVIMVIVLWAIRPRIGAIAGALLVIGSTAVGLASWFRRLSRP
jgi:hypothetical protein